MNHQFERPYTFDRVVRILISIAIVIGLYLLIRTISGALLPFVLGWLLAYLINPAVEFCQKRLHIRYRGVAIALSLLVIFGSLTGIIFALSPYISGELSRFVEVVDRFRNESGHIQIIPASWIEFINTHIDFDEIIHNLTREDIHSILTNMGSGAQKIFSGSLSILGGFFMIFLVMLYMVFILVDYDRVVKGIPSLLPPKYKETILMVFNDMKAATNRYFRGQALVVLCV
ncbi:MAG: AI-2E family transporter, partial [Rikenellaceae bacterium]|nr:AI-2E family transporter [Rikenellaceae bacterium]